MSTLVLELSTALLDRLQSHAQLLGLPLEEAAVRALEKGLPGQKMSQASLFDTPDQNPTPANKASEDAPLSPQATRRSKPLTSGFDGTWMLWTDGACSGNPGPGGFGVIVVGPDGEEEFSRGFKATTNNRMEMRGAIAAIERVAPGSSAILHTDSRYVIDAIEKKWVEGWMRRGWRKADGGEVKNVDLWILMTEAMRGKKIKFKWVEGHAGNVGNERCDKLAVAAAKGTRLEPDREG
jgi:ribonuclease HI